MATTAPIFDNTGDRPVFTLPGFTLEEVVDSSSTWAIVGTLDGAHEPVRIRLFQKKEFAFGYLVSNIWDTLFDTPIWTYDPVRDNGLMARLAMAGEYPVIALIGRGRHGMVERVTPLDEILVGKEPTVLERAKLKVWAGESLERGVWLTDAERCALGRNEAANRIAATTETKPIFASVKVPDPERKRIREEKRNLFMMRKEVTAVTATGERRCARLALETEWRILPNRTGVILVDGFGEDGAPGNPLEFFEVVRKKGRNPEKTRVVTLTGYAATEQKQAANATKPVEPPPAVPHRSVLVERKKDRKRGRVFIFDDKEAFNQARAKGLNGGAWCAYKEPEADGSLTVYAVRQGAIDTIGNCRVIQEA